MHLCLVCVSFALCTEHCLCFHAVRGLSLTLLYSYLPIVSRVFRNRKPPPHPWVFFAVILFYTGTANIFFPTDTYLSFDQRSLRESPAGRVSASGYLIHSHHHHHPNSICKTLAATLQGCIQWYWGLQRIHHTRLASVRECICRREAKLGTALQKATWQASWAWA